MELVHYDFETIRINGNDYSFSDFNKLEPTYRPPFGFVTRVYRRGTEHYISDGANKINFSLIDPEMDRICNREGELARLVLSMKKQTSGTNQKDRSVVQNRKTVLKQKMTAKNP